MYDGGRASPWLGSRSAPLVLLDTLSSDSTTTSIGSSTPWTIAAGCEEEKRRKSARPGIERGTE